MKLIRTEDAVGSVLCHDLTQIIKGVTKDAVFRKGHVVQPEDIPVLLSIGKEHLYVWEADESMLHENDAARILCDICKNTMMDESPVKEGKIELAAAADGLFKVDSARLRLVNSFGQMMIATRHGNTPVKKGDKLCGTRIIPLVIEKEKMQRVRELCGDEPLLQLLPYKIKKAAVLATGSEVFHGRIKDTFTPVLEEKLAEFNVEVVYKQVLDDKPEQITAAIKTAIEEKGAEMVLCTGGTLKKKKENCRYEPSFQPRDLPRARRDLPLFGGGHLLCHALPGHDRLRRGGRYRRNHHAGGIPGAEGGTRRGALLLPGGQPHACRRERTQNRGRDRHRR